MADYYPQLPGPHGRDTSLAGGYWDENAESEENVEASGDGYFAGTPLVPAAFFGPDYATGLVEPSEAAVTIT